MIRFADVTKTYNIRGHSKTVLRNATLTLDTAYSYAIFGPNGAGKSTTLRLIAGTDLPTRGAVRRSVLVSWPLGFAGGFHGEMTGRENVIFVARIYGADIKRVVDFVIDFAEIGHYFDLPTKTYSSGMQARLAFGLSMAIEFDIYLVDEVTGVGDARFQAKCVRAFSDRRAKSRVVLVSHSYEAIKDYCNRAIVLQDGKLIHFSDIDAGIAHYRRMIGV